MQIICHIGLVSQTLQEVMCADRTYVFEEYLSSDSKVEKDVLSNNGGTLYDFFEQGLADNLISDKIEGVDDSDDYIS